MNGDIPALEFRCPFLFRCDKDKDVRRLLKETDEESPLFPHSADLLSSDTVSWDIGNDCVC